MLDMIELKKIGLKATSSFPGFCSNHDSNLFKKIDNPKLKITNETSEMLVFRTFVHEAYKKICAQYALNSFQHKDSSIDFERSVNVEGFQLGYTDLMMQAKSIYKNMKQKKYSYKYLNIEFSQSLPFCFIAPINFDIKPAFGGKDPSAHVLYESCLIGLLPTSSGSSFLLAYPTSQVKNIKLFLKRLGNSKKNLPAKVLQLALESCENLFFKPSWVEGLTREQRDLINKTFYRDLGVSDVLSSSLIPNNVLAYEGNIDVNTNTLSIKSWKSKLH